jgi:pyridoxal phosphate enzyme (YggS family)
MNINERKIADNVSRIKEQVHSAMLRAGRNPETDPVQIMAVCKTVPAKNINLCVDRGITLLGENRVQEFLEKRALYDKNATIHFIGGLQKNKVKYIIDKVRMIHSADSFDLCAEVNKRALAAGIIMDILFEVNLAGEPSKHGVPPEALPDFAGEVAAKLPSLNPRGIMVIPPAKDSARRFDQARRLFEDLRAHMLPGYRIDTLSMGMSGDFEQAIHSGSTLIRLGSALFGERV